MRVSSRFLAPLWLALAALVLGLPQRARATGAAVELLSPRPGATLVAGSNAELEWLPAGGFERFPKVEEWEAFLSLDGGATYPVRITPHLDQDLRRVRWQVPPVASPDARILLRFGDEQRETAVELPARFAIVDSLSQESGFLLSQISARAGEPALPGHRGVVSWVEGSRRGGGLRQVVAAGQPSLRAGLVPPEARDESAVLASEPAPPRPPAPVPGGLVAAVRPASCQSLGRRHGSGPAPSFDILLLIQRQNE